MSVKLLRTVHEVRRETRLARLHTQRIGLVPTMGFLHEGHASLLRRAREVSDLVALSIFVNPTQFGPGEDLSRYPRDLDGDLAKAAAAGADLAFVPTVEEMYPEGFQSCVEVRELSLGMCGDRRHGHFSGVATAVLKLFQIVQPHVAFFGEKDYQQLQVVRRMVRDLDVPVEVVGIPTVRERDGLALSSRNAYLTAEERRQALSLFRSLTSARERWAAGERRGIELLGAARRALDAEPGVKVEYLELRDADSLREIDGEVGRPAVLAVAAFLGTTRLIDNLILRG